LLYKWLDSGCFRCPRNEAEDKLLTEQEVRWLFEGLELEQLKTIKPGIKSTKKYSLLFDWGEEEDLQDKNVSEKHGIYHFCPAQYMWIRAK